MEQPPLQRRLPGDPAAEHGNLLPGPGYTAAYSPRHPSREPGSGSVRPLAAAGLTAPRPQDRSQCRRRAPSPRDIVMEAAAPGPRSGWRAGGATAAHGPPPGSGSRNHCRCPRTPPAPRSQTTTREGATSTRHSGGRGSGWAPRLARTELDGPDSPGNCSSPNSDTTRGRGAASRCGCVACKKLASAQRVRS